jgi:RND family efflux transporter MFP subunit
VRIVRAKPGDWQHVVHTEGTVRARTNTDLVPEVAGRVSWISPSLRAGGLFEEGEVLLRLEPRDHEVAVKRARAALLRSRGELQLAKLHLGREQDLQSRAAAAQADLDEAIARETTARAAVLEAEATFDQATADLERTELWAPFTGRVVEKSVDVGQFVTRGVAVASLYSIDTAEISLPIRDDELVFANLHMEQRGDQMVFEGPPVLLRARFAGGDHVWHGRIVRTGARIDPRSRMAHVVAEVERPYDQVGDDGRPPLVVGLFVDAEIQGRRDEGVFVLPREAMRGSNRVLIVDEDSSLRFREVEPIRFERDLVILGGGLATGERVCISPLEVAVEGMKVRVESPTGEVATAGSAP